MTDDIELPKMPGEWALHTVMPDDYRYGPVFGYRAGDMQAYARAAILADRERRAQPAPGAEALLTALKDIAEWTERWTTADHPVATVARKAIAAHSAGKGEV